MTSVRARTAHRLMAAAVATGLSAACVAAGAPPAAAHPGAAHPAAHPAAGQYAAQGVPAGGQPEQRNGATATLNGLTTADEAVITVDGERQEISAGLFEMAVDGGGTLQTYGIDALNPVQEQSRYAEGEGKTSPLWGNRNAGRIRWVVDHSYPHRNDLQALAKAAGAKRLTPQAAAAGTQVAIWRFAENGARG
uniref:TQXA domain-containing protein n=1 Tax=Streptomyces sp. PU-14G TaxID=2800808 RepID=UPI0034DFCAC6